MTGDQRSDGELLARLPRQPELMGTLYERHAPAVFRYLARRAGPAPAEDLLSEVFIAALDARKRVVAHRSGSALPWLYGIAINVLRQPNNLGSDVFDVGGTGLTWDELYALPTDPAKLEPVLQSDIKGAGPNPTAELYTVVGDLLRESPAPPALREALYEIAVGIPGVKLVGHYKDALGRTGTAVERDGETLVIDPGNGELLADISGNPKTGISCGGGCEEYGAAYMFVSGGPATSAPAVPTNKARPGGAAS